MRVQLTADEIMQQASISRSALQQRHQQTRGFKPTPDWCSIKRKIPRTSVRDRLQSQPWRSRRSNFLYKIWINRPAGPDTELIEVKAVDRWKDATVIPSQNPKIPNPQKTGCTYLDPKPNSKHIGNHLRSA
jgi:hypothetical protein